jgi:hypothetical protein
MFVLRNLYILLLILVDMKKFGVLFVLSLFLVSGFVSAQSFSNPIEGVVDGIAGIFSPIARALFGSGQESVLNGEEIFIKFLVFLLVLIFGAAAAKNIPLLKDKPFSSFLVAAIIGVIGVRYVTTPELINTLWLPTSTFAVALTSIIPFALFFFLIEGFDSSVLRKFGWTTYLVIFLYFTITRWPALKVGPGDYANAALIYLVIAVVSGILIFADRQIHAMFRYRSIKGITDSVKKVQAEKISAEIDDLYVQLSRAKTSAGRAAIEQQISILETNLKTMYS